MEIENLFIPEGVNANLQLPDLYLLNYYEGLSNRQIWVEDEITSSINEVTKKILWWNSEDNDKDIPAEKRIPIKIMISSQGGDLYSALCLADVIRASNTPVHTVNMGLAASAACLILISGDVRYATKHSTAMWHSGSCTLEGALGQIQSATKHFDGLENKLRDYFIERTKVDICKYRRNKDKDWYFDANEQLECGLVDKIVANIYEII